MPLARRIAPLVSGTVRLGPCSFLRTSWCRRMPCRILRCSCSGSTSTSLGSVTRSLVRGSRDAMKASLFPIADQRPAACQTNSAKVHSNQPNQSVCEFTDPAAHTDSRVCGSRLRIRKRCPGHFSPLGRIRWAESCTALGRGAVTSVTGACDSPESLACG